MRTGLCCAVVLAVFLVVGVVSAQRQEVTIKTTKVAGTVSMLEGQGGNIGVCAGEDGVLMIDDEFAPLADKIRKAVNEIEGNDDPIRFLVNTHWHGDHTGGNAIFGREALIVAQDNVRKRLASPQSGRRQPARALPVITFADSVSFHWNGEDIDVVHFPRSHTDGDSVIFFRGSNVVHMGDLFFNGLLPFVDRDSGGDVLGLTRSIETLLEEIPDDAHIIPGHGPLGTKKDLKRYHTMLVETTELVRSGRAAGKSVEDIVKAGLPAQWKSWASPFVDEKRWIETIYACLDAADHG